MCTGLIPTTRASSSGGSSVTPQRLRSWSASLPTTPPALSPLDRSQTGRKLHAQWSHNIIYYRCGSSLLTGVEPCDMAEHALVESDLLPVIDGLLGDFFNGAKLPGVGPRVSQETAAEAIKKLKGKLVRIGERYDDGDIEKADYQAKRDALKAQIGENESQTTPLPDKGELLTIGEMWRKGDVKQRWTVLSSLFERIEMRDRKVAGFKPRADTTGKVRMLIQ